MNIFILLLSTLIAINLSSNELQWVNEQITAIKPPRSGISSDKIDATQSPFIFLSDKKNETIKKTIKSPRKTTKIKTTRKKRIIQRQGKGLHLDAIINHSVLINGKWYKRNAKVGKYKVSVINRSNVILTYKNKTLLLSIISKNKKLKFKRN